jgi:hypothetical protein
METPIEAAGMHASLPVVENHQKYWYILENIDGEQVGKLTVHPRKLLGLLADLVDFKNINNMNEAFERQFSSGCLGSQITTKIGFTDKTCCSNTLISYIVTYFTM